MHGFSSGSTCLVNAEVDSMGGVVDGGVGIDSKPSPCLAAIEKAQAELRLEYDVLEERRRELEFLEKGGNPLDFKFGHAASISVQSTSRTDQHADQLLTSEAKGSFALTASPHGDSVESSGRLGVTTACEPNSADNFDGENEIPEDERKSRGHGRVRITPSQHSSQLDVGLNAKSSEDSPIFHPKRGQAYRRRNRSRPNRDGPRSSSTDVGSRVGHGPCLPKRHAMLSKPILAENQSEMESESDGTHTLRLSATSRDNEFLEGKRDTPTSKDKQEELQHQGVKAEGATIATCTFKPDPAAEQETIVPADNELPACSDAVLNKNDPVSVELNESNKMNGDGKCNPTEGLPSNTGQTTKGLDSESSCTQTSLSAEGNGNIDSETCLNSRKVDSNGSPKEQKLSLGEKSVSKHEKMLNKKRTCREIEGSSYNKEDQSATAHPATEFAEKDKEESDRGRSATAQKAECLEANDHTEPKPEGWTGTAGDSIPRMEISPVRLNSAVDPSSGEPNRTDCSASLPASQLQTCVGDQPKVVDKAQEDRILEEARIIEAKCRRIAELSGGLLTREYRQKSHWDFVVEEMAWLANDFAQERLWKMNAASQICHQVAFASRIRLEEQTKRFKEKSVAHILAKAVMEFWNSAGSLAGKGMSSDSGKCLHDAKADESEIAGYKVDSPDKEPQCRGPKGDLAVHRYAVRFLKYNFPSKPFVKVEVSESPIASDIDMPEISWQDQFTEENLFYIVPPGAMDTYRKSIESCLAESQRTTNDRQGMVDASMYDAPAEYGYQENDYEEDEGENAYYLPGAFAGSKPSKKKRKNMKSYAARAYDSGGEFGYGQYMENKNGALQSVLVGKRSSNNLHVGLIPTKKMRTASRQRVVGFFSAGSAMATPAPNRSDAFSGDTNSFQDDQSTLHGGCVVPRNSEVDSAEEFEKQSRFDSREVSTKHKKKKKKIKHQRAASSQTWLPDSAMQNEQKDNARKRQDGYQLETNGNCLFAEHTKRLKVMRQSLDNSFDNAVPMSGSVASPVASQMSNMSNQSKIIKLIGGRDRGKKAKTLKVISGQPGSGSPWTLFEDQALVVLVHDMGPNWELVSDAMNSTLQFKCIFRKPKECKERHKILMDRTSGDGADSAEDSGSSQPYPSTLPGIPKGSARQLFQRLQGPMEEDTIKSHFEKIILIGQQLHYQKRQNGAQDLKQIVPEHGSHMVALSQVIPNNLNGITLTPLDFCDAPASSQDLLALGYQGHAGGLPLSNQGGVPPMHSPAGANSSLQGSSSMGVGNNLASPSSQFNSPRYPGGRSVSLPVEEQQRLQQYNQLLHGRNMQASNFASGSDRGVHPVPGGNGVDMMPGMNRSGTMPRPGHQGPASSSMLNSGNMLTSNMREMPSSSINMASSQGNPMFRPRDSLHLVKPGQSSEHQRHMIPEMSGTSSGFTNQNTSHAQPYASHHHQQKHPMQQQQQHSHVLNNGQHHPHLPRSNHPASPQQQALLRIARERQLQHRLLQRKQLHQQQQQLLSSSAMMTHTQTPPQPSVSSSLQNSSHLQSPVSSQSVALPPLSPSSPMTQQQQQQMPAQGVGRSGQNGAAGMMAGKQRQRQAQQLQQQYQQSGRHHPHLKGTGRSNMPMHQSLAMDSSHLNGPQMPDKGEQAAHLMQGQGSYSGLGPTTAQPSKQPMASPQNSSQSQSQKPYANAIPAVPGASASPASDQGASSTALPSTNHQRLQGKPQSNLMAANQSHPAHKRQIHPMNSETQLQADHSQSEQQFAGNVSSAMVPSSSPAMPSSPSSSGAVSSPGITCSSGNESLSSVSQSLLRQLSGKSASQGNSLGAQRQQQQSHLQPSLLPQKQSQHQFQQIEPSTQRVPQ